MECTRCHNEAEEFCWRCSEKTLCVPCWDEYGCCEADEGSGACVTKGGVLIPNEKPAA